MSDIGDKPSSAFAEAIVHIWLETARIYGKVPCLFCDGNIYRIDVGERGDMMMGHSDPVCKVFEKMMSDAIPLPRDIKA